MVGAYIVRLADMSTSNKVQLYGGAIEVQLPHQFKDVRFVDPAQSLTFLTDPPIAPFGKSPIVKKSTWTKMATPA